MLITTAPWLLVLGKVVMTPERRRVGVVVNYICSLAVPLSYIFGMLSLCGICYSCRADLEKIKKYKGIRMVRRYRDKLNKRRVAGDSAFNYNGFTCLFGSIFISIIAQTLWNLMRVVSMMFQSVSVKVGSKDLKRSQVYPWHFSYHVPSLHSDHSA